MANSTLIKLIAGASALGVLYACGGTSSGNDPVHLTYPVTRSLAFIAQNRTQDLIHIYGQGQVRSDDNRVFATSSRNLQTLPITWNALGDVQTVRFEASNAGGPTSTGSVNYSTADLEANKRIRVVFDGSANLIVTLEP